MRGYIGGQYEPQRRLSETFYHLFHQGFFHMARRGEVRKFRVNLEDRMEKELVSMGTESGTTTYVDFGETEGNDG